MDVRMMLKRQENKEKLKTKKEKKKDEGILAVSGG